MKKGIMALEGMELPKDTAPPAPVVPTPVKEPSLINEDHVVLDEVVKKTSDTCDLIDQSADIAKTVGKVVDAVDAAVESGNGIDPTAAAIANAAMEHFYNFLDYNPKKGRPKVSMEDLSTGKKRVATAVAALEELKAFQKKLHKNLKRAYEELIEDVGESMEASGDQTADALAAIDAASAKFDEAGPKEDMVDGGSWAAPFGEFDQELATGDDVVKRVEEFAGAVKKADPEAAAADVAATAAPAEGAAPGDADDKDVNELGDAAETIRGVMEKKEGETSDETNFAALTAEQKTKLVEFAKQIGDQIKGVGEKWDKLEETVAPDVAAASDDAPPADTPPADTPPADGEAARKVAAEGLEAARRATGGGEPTGGDAPAADAPPAEGAADAPAAEPEEDFTEAPDVPTEPVRDVVEVNASLVKVLIAIGDYITKSTK